MIDGKRRSIPRPRGRLRARHFGAVSLHPGIYDRARDLPRLLPLMESDLETGTLACHARLVGLLRQALRKERQRGKQGHWSYDVGRHRALLAAFRHEEAALRARLGLSTVPPTDRLETKSWPPMHSPTPA